MHHEGCGDPIQVLDLCLAPFLPNLQPLALRQEQSNALGAPRRPQLRCQPGQRAPSLRLSRRRTSST
eukprot:3328858-Rhodomonas_salina.1